MTRARREVVRGRPSLPAVHPRWQCESNRLRGGRPPEPTKGATVVEVMEVFEVMGLLMVVLEVLVVVLEGMATVEVAEVIGVEGIWPNTDRSVAARSREIELCSSTCIASLISTSM